MLQRDPSAGIIPPAGTFSIASPAERKEKSCPLPYTNSKESLPREAGRGEKGMSELSRARDAALDRYEQLLLLKEDMERECFRLEQEHTREFGKEVLEIFRLEIECARKVKAIEYCRMYLDRGLEPDGEALQQHVQQETQELIGHLHAMQRTWRNAMDAAEAGGEGLEAVKPLHPGIRKRTHPDIPDVEEKIRELEWEIREIRSKDPYQYKNLFSRPELVGEKHLDLQRQAEEYRQYSAQLEEKLGSILPEGTLLIWSHEW